MTAGARLSVLDLSDNAFGPDGVKGIERLLKSRACHTLQELKLNNCGMGIGGGKVSRHDDRHRHHAAVRRHDDRLRHHAAVRRHDDRTDTTLLSVATTTASDSTLLLASR